jgi:acyl-CoA thioesterase-1
VRYVVLVGLLAWVGGSIAGCSATGVGSGAPAGAGTGPGSGAPSASHEVAQAGATTEPLALRYVALGDSYTIGTSIDFEGRWPNQLVNRLGAAAPTLRLVANLGVNGFTSGDVIASELPRLDALRPDFLTVLIGVNDVVQGVPSTTYRTNAGRILDELRARLPANRIVAVGTPDYTVTPQGAAYGDPASQAAGIRTNNSILKEVAVARGITFVDIYDLSLRAATDRSLVAGDGLHPSAAQYALWVDRIEPVVSALLGHRPG